MEACPFVVNGWCSDFTESLSPAFGTYRRCRFTDASVEMLEFVSARTGAIEDWHAGNFECLQNCVLNFQRHDRLVEPLRCNVVVEEVILRRRYINMAVGQDFT